MILVLRYAAPTRSRPSRRRAQQRRRRSFAWPGIRGRLLRRMRARRPQSSQQRAARAARCDLKSRHKPPSATTREPSVNGHRAASRRRELRPKAARALTMTGVPAQQSAASTAPSTLAVSATSRLAREATPSGRTAISCSLNWWAGDRAIGAEYATIAGLRSQAHVAARAFVEEHACIGRHA